MYQATDIDRRFAAALTRVMAHDGRWIAPCAGLIYQFNRLLRVMTLVNPDVLANSESLECHQRTIIVFATAGWQVVEETRH